MRKVFTTNNSKETQKLGELFAMELKSGAVICLSGDLGAGKTTFAQGLLKGLKAKGPYTSPTFVIMKKYDLTNNKQQTTNNKKLLSVVGDKLSFVYHIDAYRVEAKDIISLGWEEMVAEKGNIIIIEWADRIRKIIPREAIWIKFKNIEENKRKIIFE